MIPEAALLGHAYQERIEGYVGERCECGRWSDSAAEYIAHIEQATK